MAQNEKNKTTLFYETFLVQTMKLVLDFRFEPLLANFEPFYSF